MSAPGELIAQRYRLKRLLGTGGMGVVWEAFDERLHRTVAVKQLHPQPWLNDTERELATSRAMREGRITARLDHPHAVPVYDVVEDEGMPCLVMQFQPAEPLSTVLERRQTLTAPEVADLGAQVASAIWAAHDVGIVHRDVKPGNILLTQDGTARITDFGIAHAMGDVTLTSTGLVTGTPAYLAPEVARGDPSGFPADVFSLGATLYTALEGRPSFGTDANRMALLRRVAAGAIIPPRRSGPLTALLVKMLAPDPDSRPAMSQVAARLAAMQRAARAPIHPTAAEAQTTAETTAPPPTIGTKVAASPDTEAAAPPSPIIKPYAGTVTEPSAPQNTEPSAAPVTEPPTSQPSAAQVIDSAHPTEPPPLLPVGRPVEEPLRRRRGLALVGALVAIALVALALALRPDRPPERAAPSTRPTPHAVSTSASSTTAPLSTTPPTSPSPSRPVSTTARPSPRPSAATSKPVATRSPASGVVVAGTPTASELTRAITSYYDLLPGGTDQTWPLMTANYQTYHAGGRRSYQRFWDQYSRVIATNVIAVAPSTVEATLTYYSKSGGVIRERTSYGMVNDGGVLRISSSRVLSSP